jgi:hypothetical protein
MDFWCYPSCPGAHITSEASGFIKYKFIPTNALLLFSMLLQYNIYKLFQSVSIPIEIILRDTL